MSDIEIGSVWVGKADSIRSNDRIKVTKIKVWEDGERNILFEYLDKLGAGSEREVVFLEQFEKQDMVNHPPHYKDASGIECIEVTKQGRKDDSAKRRYSLLPTGTVNSVVDVLEFGAIKYAPDNWQKVPDARRRYYDAAMRHIDSWFGGEVKDIETGLPHLAHAVCCLLFLIWFDNKA